MGFSRRQNVSNLNSQGKLIVAIMRNDVPMVKHLISNDEDVNKSDVERRCPIHLASSIGGTQIVSLLIEAGARVNVRDNEWVSSLHRACRNNHDDVVSLLLANGADANLRDRSWVTPMHVCAANNALECAKVILPHVNNIDMSDRSGATALHHAVFNSHCDLITFLLANKAQANAFDKLDRRPIHYAASVDSTDAIRFLVVKGGAEVNVHDKYLMTPLHVAAARGSLNALQLLLDYGANINAIDVHGNQALHWAALHGQDDIIDELIVRGVQLNAANHSGITALHYSAASTPGHGALDVLLNHKDSIDMNAKDNHGRTALHLAAKYGRHSRIQELIRCGANYKLTDKNLCTALHYAAREGHTPVINILCQTDIDVNLLDSGGMTPLHYAAFAGVSNACKQLLEAKANPQLRDASGRTPHFFAAFSGNIECLQMMLPLPEKLSDAYNRSILHYASSKNSFDILEFILKSYRNHFDVNQRDINGMTALHFASFNINDDNRCVEFLLENGSKPEIADNNGFLPIHYASASGMTSALSLLINSHNSRDLKMRICPTHCAAFYGKQECLQILLENDFHDIGPALEYAILKEYNGCVKVIMEFLKNASNLSLPPIISQSIHVASQFSLHDTLSLLLNYIPNVDLRDHRGRTPLMLASLSESGIECVELLLKSKADPNARDNEKRTALFYAIYSGNEDIVKILLKYGANPTIASLNGKTPFHLAASMGNTDVLYSLLNYHQLINKFSPEVLVDKEGCTPIHWAVLKSQHSSLSAILESSQSKKFFGSKVTPLHLAAYVLNNNSIELLLSHYGKEIVLSVDMKGRTALHFACMSKESNTNILDLFINNGIDMNCVDINGQTPLMYASKLGNASHVEHLLIKGVDVTIKDNKSNTALHHACINSHDDCGVKILKKCHSLANATNDDIRTPLHISAGNGLVYLTQELILAGASVNINDIDGMTPSLCCAKNADVADCLMLIESIMLHEAEPRKSLCDNRESASSSVYDSRQSIIKRKSAQIFCDNNVSNVSVNNISDHHSSDSDFY